MQKSTLDLLKLNENSTATDVDNAIVTLLQHLESHESVIAQLTESRNHEVVETAISLGKITYGQAEDYKILLRMNYNSTKKLIDSIPASKVGLKKDLKVSDLIKRGRGQQQENIEQAQDSNTPPKDKSKWSLQHYRKFAPNELRSNPTLYRELIEKESNNKK